MSTPEPLDRLVASATPWPQHHVESLLLADARRDLLEDLMATPVVDQPRPAPTRRRSRWLVPVAAVLAVLVAVGVPVWIGGHGVLPSHDRLPGPSYSSQDRRLAVTSPRLLVTAPGWSVSKVDAASRAEGEMTFTDGKHLDTNGGTLPTRATWDQGLGCTEAPMDATR